MEEALNEEIEKAKKLLNEHDYVVIPVDKSQMCLCETCRESSKKCCYNAIGYACCSLLCINEYIKEQLDYKDKIEAIMSKHEE